MSNSDLTKTEGQEFCMQHNKVAPAFATFKQAVFNYLRTKTISKIIQWVTINQQGYREIKSFLSTLSSPGQNPRAIQSQ
jgi:galactose-1-phosphate uridylyltransferase